MVRGVYLFKLGGDYLPWDKLWKLPEMEIEFPKKLLGDVYHYVSNYNPDTESLILRYDRSRKRYHMEVKAKREFTKN